MAVCILPFHASTAKLILVIFVLNGDIWNPEEGQVTFYWGKMHNMITDEVEGNS